MGWSFQSNQRTNNNNKPLLPKSHNKWKWNSSELILIYILREEEFLSEFICFRCNDWLTYFWLMPQLFMYVWVIRNPFSFWLSARSKHRIRVFLSLHNDVCFVLAPKLKNLPYDWVTFLLNWCRHVWERCAINISLFKSAPRESRVWREHPKKKRFHDAEKFQFNRHICLTRAFQIFVYCIEARIESSEFVRKPVIISISCKYSVRTIEYITSLVRWFVLMPTRYTMKQDKLCLKRQSLETEKMRPYNLFVSLFSFRNSPSVFLIMTFSLMT